MTGASGAAVAVADWGTTRLRLWLLDAAGRPIDEHRSDDGMLAAQPDRFAAILESTLEGMGAPASLPVVICGMAGARQGWVEAPYATVPASLDRLFGSAIRVPGARREVRIVPGIAQQLADAPDVMRGEETQLAGAVAMLAPGRYLACMPGTHSKWVEIDHGVVTGFQTFMTGELFSLLSQQSIIRHALGGSTAAVRPDDAHFARACSASLSAGGEIMNRLFRIRAASLLHGLGPANAAAVLSGALIGAEIASALRVKEERGEVILVASGAMRQLYASALDIAGVTARQVDADAAVREGLLVAARLAGFLPQGGEGQ